MLPARGYSQLHCRASEDGAALAIVPASFRKAQPSKATAFVLAALTSITGDWWKRFGCLQKLQLTRGHIYPRARMHSELEALSDDGSRVFGKTQITAGKGKDQWFRCPKRPASLYPGGGGSKRGSDYDWPDLHELS